MPVSRRLRKSRSVRKRFTQNLGSNLRSAGSRKRQRGGKRSRRSFRRSRRSKRNKRGGFNEELREINFSIGTEYWYANQFAIRGGYFFEHDTKGGRKFFTFGSGVKYNVFELDFSYLINASRAINGNNPLANTMRFSLIFDFGEIN